MLSLGGRFIRLLMIQSQTIFMIFSVASWFLFCSIVDPQKSAKGLQTLISYIGVA